MNPSVPAEVVVADAEIEALHGKMREQLGKVRPLLMGRLVRRDGQAFKVTAVHLAMGHISLEGIRVSKKGAVGIRQFYIGHAILCEFDALSTSMREEGK